MSTTSAAILALAGHALALPSSDRRAENAVPTSVWESVEAAPADWVKDAIEAEADETFELRIALAAQNMPQFHQLVMDVR